jgi:hypothetical protein
LKYGIRVIISKEKEFTSIHNEEEKDRYLFGPFRNHLTVTASSKRS